MLSVTFILDNYEDLEWLHYLLHAEGINHTELEVSEVEE